VVTHSSICHNAPSKLRFNPSVGILGGHTSSLPPSVSAMKVVSIPQSGFLVVTPGTIGWWPGGWARFQSLSRDSWWSHMVLLMSLGWSTSSFNPSVGILGGHTRGGKERRDTMSFVSIPQSGFLVVTHDAAFQSPLRAKVFQSLSRDSWWSHLSRQRTAVS
jgi:hypothetical protein